MAEGDFIARIDADDIWKRNKLKKQVDFLEENKNYALVGTAYDEIHNNEIHHRGQAHPLAVAHCDIIKVVARFNPFAHSSVVFRANILHVIGYYNEKFKYSQDYEFWVRIMSTYKVANLNEVLVSLGCFGNSISVEKEKAQRVFAIRSKLLAINVLDKSLFEYRHLFNDVLAVVLPKSITNLIRRFKLHSK
jgi:glycosyltransferase involved in cell wall biosynthesis